jgi:ferric iron reductase protein FhuF
MSQRKNKHSHHKHGNHPQKHNRKQGASMHKKWTTWVVVILMLAAMLAYVVSDDEELAPESDGQRMPAAAE